MYNSTDIGIFIMVARTLNISQAAQRLNISQSTVSKRLKELEESLHLTLVERGQGMKALRLTQAGENFLTIANEMQRLWEQAQHMEYKRSVFSIASLSSLNRQAIPGISDFLHEHISNLHLRILTSHSQDIYDLVEQHEADLGFTLFAREYPNVHVEPWFSEPLVVVRPKGTLLSGPVCTPQELRPENEVYNYNGIRFQDWHDEWWPAARNSYVSLDNADLIPLLLNKPGQWTILQASLARRMAATGNYCLQQLSPPPPARHCYLITHLHPTQRIARIMDVLRPYLQEMAEGWNSTAEMPALHQTLSAK